MKLNGIELKAVEICQKVQNECDVLGKNLTDDIRENSKHLVRLYLLRRLMDELSESLPKHEVIDNLTGKSLGYLYDNGYIGGVMMSTNIKVNSAIRHTEWYMSKISCKKLIL